MFSRKFEKVFLNCLARLWTIWKESIQENESYQKFSVQSVMITFILYLNVTDPLIISLIFIFLPWREKAHDNKFCRENSKPRRESRIKTC